MSGRYLVELGDVLRGAGLAVIEYPEWQTRARSSGGFADDRPWCVVWHHTASSSPPENDAAYCAEGDPDAPIYNLLIDDTGTVWLIAAGAVNSAGKGYAMAFSRGTVPDDEMNTNAIALCLCNNGIGQPYSVDQIEAALTASLAMTNAYGLDATDVAQHVDWAPDRKIDPATADAVQGYWHPHPVNSSGSWALEDLRAELANRAGTPPWPPGPTPPLQEDDTMLIAALDQNGTAWIGDGMTRFELADPAVFDNYVLVHRGRLVNVSGGAVTGWDTIGAPVGGPTLEALGRPV